VGLNDAIEMAQTVFYGGGDGPAFGLYGSDGAPVCGTAIWGGPAGTLGASVARYDCPGAGVVSAHEMGHSSGLDHNDTQSFMHDDSFDSPSLPAADKAKLIGCVSTFDCPRPSGFRYNP
jgi:hypothetical protein